MNILPRPSLSGSITCLLTKRQPILLHTTQSSLTLSNHTTTTTTTTHANLHQTRHSSTARRHRKLLQLPPAPFLNGPQTATGSSGRSRAALYPPAEQDHIVFTPPPSAPNVYHTPPIFLPKGDVRRIGFEAAEKARREAGRRAKSSTTTTTADSSMGTLHTTTPIPAATSPRWPSSLPLPPAVTTPYKKSYHLTPADMAEMRALRQEDETKWTRSKLAERFQCSALFVGMVVQASEARVKGVWRERRKVEAQWGERRRKARSERGRRREGWGRGE